MGGRCHHHLKGLLWYRRRDKSKHHCHPWGQWGYHLMLLGTLLQELLRACYQMLHGTCHHVLILLLIPTWFRVLFHVLFRVLLTTPPKVRILSLSKVPLGIWYRLPCSICHLQQEQALMPLGNMWVRQVLQEQAPLQVPEQE